MKNKMTTIVLIALFSIGTIVEYIVGFNLLKKKITDDNTFYSEYASDYGQANVTIEELYEYEEAPRPEPTGDVAILDGCNVNVRVDGSITDDSFTTYGYITYAWGEESTPTRLNYNKITGKQDEWNTAFEQYLDGHPEQILQLYGVNIDSAGNTYYQQSTPDGRTPVIYSETSDIYYQFINKEDFTVAITSNHPFEVTKDPGTVHYGDPHANPMFTHSYSPYEVVAAANTRREFLENENDPDSSPYGEGQVLGTSDTYTSSADNNRRRQMVSYSNYVWDKNGTADGTTLLVDTTSAEAKASEWVLTETEYSYQFAGLSVYGLSGSRSASAMSIQGTVSNSINAERPYVVVVKFLNEAKELLTLKVCDNRANPLGAASTSNSAQNFSVQISSDDCDVQSVTSVQFEVY